MLFNRQDSSVLTNRIICRLIYSKGHLFFMRERFYDVDGECDMNSGFSFKHLLSIEDVSRSDVELVLARAAEFHAAPGRSWDIARGKILASLFFEPSTRTRFSFESAMYRLGGNVITLESGSASSVQKGESLSDMGRIMSGYCDVAAMRYPMKGSVREFAEFASVPVINAGDGANQHPSQSLLDAYTIFHFHKRLDSLAIGLAGDLKFGRTVNSLVRLLSLFSGITFYCVSHPFLGVSADLVDFLRQKGHTVVESDSLADVMPYLDVLYMTRVQRERFSSEKEYLDVKDFCLLTLDDLKFCRPTLSILHPLPRVNEISLEVDSHSAARFFDQAKFGLFVRMALLSEMLTCG